MRSLSVAAVIVAAFTLAAASAHAKVGFVVSIPNALTFSCNTCHTKTTEPVEWNAFGLDVQETLVDEMPDWAAVCAEDSDGDGFSNGAELADPDCEWAEGDDNPDGDVTNPGDEDSKPAGVDEDAGGSTDQADAGGSDNNTGGGGSTTSDGGSTTSDGGGGCVGGSSSAPLSGLALLLAVAWMSRRRVA